MWKHWFAVLSVPLFLLGLTGCAKPPYHNVDNTELQALLAQGVPIYDVRRPEEWKQTGIVAGSRTLTWVDKGGKPDPAFFPAFTAQVGKNTPVILICRTGNRTDLLARELMVGHGYTQVYNVRHGITGWLGDKLPVVKG